ncbi:MAG: ATP-binding protein [Gemmatimonadota bacterium]|nr:ATP-binding protein [Gemmatimonadota bacterium]
MDRLPNRVRPLSSLSVRLFAVLFAAVFATFAVHLAVSTWIRTRVVEGEIRAGALRASSFLEGSLLTEMRENNRDHIAEAIGHLGDAPAVEAIRIYNKRGEVAFSSNPTEVGIQVDLEGEACVACHAGPAPLVAPPEKDLFRIYEARDGHRVLGLINPILSREGCTEGCHAHAPGQEVLGVLDVQMSLAGTDAAVMGAERLAFAAAALVVLVLGLVLAAIVRRALFRPTRQLIRGTQRLSAGDLEARLEVERDDELGLLAASFNDMAESLQHANAELREWSDTLAERVRDKTRELAEIHRQMVQVEKTSSLGKMAATVAHELNNPLSGILTCARLVARRVERQMPQGEDRERTLENLELIRSECLRCGKIVRDLLTYARGGSGDFEPRALHDLVHHAVDLMGHHMELGQVRLETDLRLDDDAVVCDGDQVVQALLALMINAVEAMPGGGTLTLSTAPDPEDRDRALLRVADTGPGIPDEVRDRIFDPFFSTKKETKGVGLGLAVVSGIVRRHGGEITVDSRRGEGTAFTLRLPRRSGGAAGGVRSTGDAVSAVAWTTDEAEET